VGLKGVKHAPDDPAGKVNIRKYVDATNVTANSWLFLNVSYDDSDVPAEVEESSLRMWRYNGSDWTNVTDTNGVNTAENYVYANITAFSVFAPLGDIEDTTAPDINFTSPTPQNGTTQSETNVEVNVSIIEANLEDVIYNWNGTNYTMYNDSLVLMMNFDNVSSLGENSTYVVDMSKYGNNGTAYNGTIINSTGKYNGGTHFDGVDDYIEIPDSNSLKTSNKITVGFWLKSEAPSSDSQIIISKAYNLTDYAGDWWFEAYNTSSMINFYLSDNENNPHGI